MKLTLVYAPASYLDMPTLGMACLQGYLKERGHGTIGVWDANLDFFHFLMDPSYLRRCLVRARAWGVIEKPELAVLEAMLEDSTPLLSVMNDPERYYQASEYNRAFLSAQRALSLLNHFEPDLEYSIHPSAFAVRFKDRQRAFSAENVVTHVLEGEMDHFSRFLIEQHPRMKECATSDVLGFSCANPDQILGTLHMARAFRESGYRGNIIVGGSFITRAREAWKTEPRLFDLVDALAVFEGEETLHEYLECLRGKQSISAVPNLIYREGTTIRETPVRKIRDLTPMPTPDFTGYALDRYLTPEPVLPIYASRGCYYDVCSFCNHHENYFGGYRARPPRAVHADMLAYQERHGCTKFFFVDEITSPKYQKDLCALTKGEGFRWYVHCRVDASVSEEDFSSMARGGVTLLHAGVESSSTKTLTMMDKGYRHEDVVLFLERLANVPLTTHLNTIRGFPGESPEDYLQTLEDMLEHAKVGDIVHLYDFSLLLGSPLQLRGSAHILEQTRNPGDLVEVVPFVSSPTSEPAKDIGARIQLLRTVLSKKIVFLAEIFPEDANWATHLLYVSRYREAGEGGILDQPLKHFFLEELTAFQGERWKEAAFILGKIDIFESAVACPSTLRTLDFQPRFLHWLKEQGDRPIVPAEVLSDDLDEESLREGLYRLYRIGALRIQETA